MIALCMPSVFPKYLAPALKSLEQRARQRGMDLVVNHVASLRAAHERPAQWHMDGILALDAPDEVNALLEIDPALRPPIVSLGNYYVERTDHVGIDLYPWALESVQHLLERGCRRVAYMVSEWGSQPGERRYEGYLDAVGQAGRTPELIMCPDDSRGCARERIRDYVEEKGCPDGLFCFNDEMAIGAYRGLLDIGKRVPDDIAVVGCDGIEDTEYLECPISTIIQPFDEVFAAAWQFLEQRLNDPELPLQKQMFLPRLVIRESSARRA
jgi:LacI family transcriptional regulator